AGRLHGQLQESLRPSPGAGRCRSSAVRPRSSATTSSTGWGCPRARHGRNFRKRLGRSDMAEDTGVRFDFGGRVAVITGAASGIGLQCARDFAAAGARVAVNDLDPAKVQAVAAEIGAMPLPGDVTDEAVVKALVARVAGE